MRCSCNHLCRFGNPIRYFLDNGIESRPFLNERNPNWYMFGYIWGWSIGTDNNLKWTEGTQYCWYYVDFIPSNKLTIERRRELTVDERSYPFLKSKNIEDHQFSTLLICKIQSLSRVVVRLSISFRYCCREKNYGRNENNYERWSWQRCRPAMEEQDKEIKKIRTKCTLAKALQILKKPTRSTTMRAGANIING